MIQSVRYIQKDDLKPYLPNNPIIVEAGGHRGRDAIQMSVAWPQGHIHTLEPVPHLYQALLENTKEYPNISTYHYALSDTDGSQTLYMSDEECDAVSSLLQPKLFSIKRPEVSFRPIEVQAITLISFAKRYTLSHIDLLWLDLQGYELSVLKAAQPLLQKIKAIHCEVSLEERFLKNPLYDEVREFLEAQNFSVALESLYRKTWGNVLFVKQ